MYIINNPLIMEKASVILQRFLAEVAEYNKNLDEFARYLDKLEKEQEALYRKNKQS